MEAAIETAIIQGRLSIKRIRELKEASDDIDNMVWYLKTWERPSSEKLLVLFSHQALESSMKRKYVKGSRWISTLIKRKQEALF